MSTPSSAVDLLAKTEQTKLAKLFAVTFIVGGVATGIASLFDSSSGLFTEWDNYFTALTSVLYLVSGLIIYFRPRWLTAAVLLSAIPSAVYQQGVMYLAVHQPGAASLYSAASSGPFFPLIFIVLFITLPKGASTLSWLHCAGFYVQFLLNATWFPGPQLQSSAQIEGEHLLVEVMMAYPVYILALNYIVRLRERLHAAQEEVFRQKESFLGMLSHEIRNQLQTMVSAIDLLDRKLKGAAEQRTVVRLQVAASQLQTYLNDMNELTMLEDPTLRVDRTQFELSRVLDELCDEWLPQARNQGLQLSARVATGKDREGVLLFTDRARLRQIISNLVCNALKYTEAGGVRIVAGISIDVPGFVTVKVIDTGIGIEDGSLDRIFLPHVRLENAMSRNASGSGLGLSIVERLVLSLGGSVRVESQLNKGTTFEVMVPGLVER
jgi:signal transduction histidine kinase